MGKGGEVTPEGAANTTVSSISDTNVDNENNVLKFMNNPFEKLQVNSNLSKFFFKVGAYTSNKPRMILIVCLLFTAITGLGWMKLEPEERPQKLYTSQNSEAMDDSNFVREYFPSNLNFITTYYTVGKKGGTNFLNDIDTGKDAIRDQFEAYDKIQKTNSIGKDSVYLNDICYKTTFNECRIQSVLGFWNYNITLFENDNDYVLTMSNTTATDRYSYTDSIDADRIFGGLKRDNTGRITHIEAFQMNWYVTKDQQVEGKRYVDPKGDSFSEAFTKYLRETIVPTYPGGYFHPNTDWERGEAIRGSFADDGMLTAIAYMIITIYASSVLSNADDPIASQSSLGICTVFVVGCSVISSFGILMGLGVPFSLVVNSAIFILLGLGVDDAFIILESLDRERIKHPDNTDMRIGSALSESGPSISLTSVTDFFAFLVGATSVLPALQAFCTFAAVAIFIDFILQVTLFVVYVRYDEDRREAGKNDLFSCCCIPFRKYKNMRNDKDNTTNTTNTNDNNEENRNTENTSNNEVQKTSFIRTIITQKLPDIILHPYGKIGVILSVVVLLVVSIIGITELTLDFQYSWFVPSRTLSGEEVKIHTSLDIAEKYFVVQSIPVGFFTKGSVGSNNHNHYIYRNEFDTLYTDLVRSKRIVDSSIDSWYVTWNEDTNNAGRNAVNEAAFFNSLSTWLDGNGAGYINNIIWDDPVARNYVVTTYISATLENMDSGNENIETMDDVRDLSDNYGNLGLIAFSEPFIFWEGLKIIYLETIRNVCLALAVVFICCVVFLENTYGAVLCTFNICLIDVCILGFIHWSGQYMNTVTSINILLAIGLTVDYSAHIAHSFLIAPRDTLDNRVRFALNNVGVSVFNGAMTTFIAIFALVGATSFVFQSYFKCFVIIICFGIYFGIVVLPVMLSLIGPDPIDSFWENKKELIELEMNNNSLNGSNDGKNSRVVVKHD